MSRHRYEDVGLPCRKNDRVALADVVVRHLLAVD